MRRLLPILLLLTAVATVVLTATAQSGGSYSILRSVIGSGGTAATGDSYTLSGTVGQSAVGTTFGNDVALNSGFWTTDVVLVPTAIQLALGGSQTPITAPLYLIMLCSAMMLGLTAAVVYKRRSHLML